MSRAKILGAIVVFFGVLAGAAWFDIPSTDLDGSAGRRMMVLDFLVHTVATDNFGNAGGALFYAALGAASVVVFALAGRDRAGTAIPVTAPRKAFPSSSPARLLPVVNERRRTPAGLADFAPAPTAQPRGELAEIEAAMASLPPIAGDRRASKMPAWGLMLASPWADASGLTSWLGGLPCAPAGFAWPRDDDGEPMHFYAQIELAALKPEPETGSGPPGLPQSGALLVFIGAQCAVHVLTAQEMHAAQPVAPPQDLPDLSKFGFWEDGGTFPAWPVEPHAFLAEPYDEDAYWEDEESNARPAAFPDPHRQPADWLVNWGIATLEADMTIEAVERDLRLAQDGRVGSAHRHITGYYAILLEHGPAMLAELEAWKARAEAGDPLAPVDTGALDALFERRRAFCARVEGNFSGTIALRGAPYLLWDAVRRSGSSGDAYFSLRDIDPAYRPFAEARITDWRRHRLFGIEPPFSNNWEDLRGKACLISIGADALLGTQTEHEYGLSLWGPEEDIAAGRYDRLEIVRHCAV